LKLIIWFQYNSGFKLVNNPFQIWVFPHPAEPINKGGCPIFINYFIKYVTETV